MVNLIYVIRRHYSTTSSYTLSQSITFLSSISAVAWQPQKWQKHISGHSQARHAVQFCAKMAFDNITIVLIQKLISKCCKCWRLLFEEWECYSTGFPSYTCFFLPSWHSASGLPCCEGKICPRCMCFLPIFRYVRKVPLQHNLYIRGPFSKILQCLQIEIRRNAKRSMYKILIAMQL